MKIKLNAAFRIIAATLEELIERLTRTGGKVYGEITNGNLKGFLGVNSNGRVKVYFILYPDGTMQRFEKPITTKDLKNGWKADVTDLRDPDSINKDKAKQEKLRKDEERERMFTEDIRFKNEAEIIKVCKANGIHFSGEIDAYPDGMSSGVPEDIETIDGREVATIEYCINIKNEEYKENKKSKDQQNQEWHDPIYVKFWRDSKNPEKIHAEQL